MLVLDRAHFDHMTAGDRALQIEVLGLFRQQVEAWRTRLASGDGCLAEDNPACFGRVRIRIIHKMTGPGRDATMTHCAVKRLRTVCSLQGATSRRPGQ